MLYFVEIYGYLDRTVAENIFIHVVFHVVLPIFFGLIVYAHIESMRKLFSIPLTIIATIAIAGGSMLLINPYEHYLVVKAKGVTNLSSNLEIRQLSPGGCEFEVTISEPTGLYVDLKRLGNRGKKTGILINGERLSWAKKIKFEEKKNKVVLSKYRDCSLVRK